MYPDLFEKRNLFHPYTKDPFPHKELLKYPCPHHNAVTFEI